MRLRGIALLVTLAIGLLAASLWADAQQAGKVYRVGYLGPPTRKSVEHVVQEFEQGLSRLGWVLGQNLLIEYRWAEGKYERLPALAAELVQLKVNVIVAPSSAPILAAKKATSSIPIVMIVPGDPVASGFVQSLARPGGNITGTTLFAGLEIVGKQLQLLKEAVPPVSRVAVLWNPANPGLKPVLREVETAARSLNIELQPVLEARRPEDFDNAFAVMRREHAGALFVLGDPMFVVHRARLAELATMSRLPTMFILREFVEAGGLMAYAANQRDLFRRAAVFVDKILKGAKPADLPVEQPTKFELVINMKTAKALGLTIPPSVLVRADQVIE
jgi:putative ABC transport system substrate-binding protein